VGTIGRHSYQVRLRVVHHTDSATLTAHVHRYTGVAAVLCTDEWGGYNHVERQHHRVCHTTKEWARDDDGDGIREVHTNTIEGLWTTLRNFIRPFRGVHKKYLAGYIAICELGINYKTMSNPLQNNDLRHLCQAVRLLGFDLGHCIGELVWLSPTRYY
jgi:transposase